jgi:hypothetical protein
MRSLLFYVTLAIVFIYCNYIEICTVGTGVPFPGANMRQGRDADHSPYLVPMSGMSRSCTSSPPKRLMACSGTALALVLDRNLCVV